MMEMKQPCWQTATAVAVFFRPKVCTRCLGTFDMILTIELSKIMK